MKQHLIEFLHPNLFVQVSSAPGNGYRRDNLDKSAVRGGQRDLNHLKL